SAHRVILILGVLRNISAIPLAIVIATSMTAPSVPIITEARKTSLGGKVKKLIVSNFKPAPSVNVITNWVAPTQIKVPNSVLAIVIDVRHRQPVTKSKANTVVEMTPILISPDKFKSGDVVCKKIPNGTTIVFKPEERVDCKPHFRPLSQTVNTHIPVI